MPPSNHLGDETVTKQEKAKAARAAAKAKKQQARLEAFRRMTEAKRKCMAGRSAG